IKTETHGAWDMASGLLALLDDVVALAKVAAASLDDAATQTIKASAKAAGVVIDDAAVTPRYVVGFAAERELPIIGRIARGSLKMMAPHNADANAADAASLAVDARAVEEKTVGGAIRTDFILSAKIMAISLASIASSHILTQALILLAVGVLVTVGVYSLVAIIVKADDFGVYLAQGRGTTSPAIRDVPVHTIPTFRRGLSFVGMVAMLWVGGGIIIHGLQSYGIDGPEHITHVISDAARAVVPSIGGLLAWLVGAIASAIFGLVIGAVTKLAVVPVLTPLWRAVRHA